MRGRGRGAAGRGRGRGRGRSTGRGQSRRGSHHKTQLENQNDQVEIDVNKDVNSFFVGNVSVDKHYEGQEQNRNRYAAAMAVLQKNGVEIAQNARIKALAAAWARHDYDLAEAFLQNKDSFGLNEVLKALTLLDSGRQVRILEKKLKRLQCSDGKVKPLTICKLKSDIDNLNKIKPLHGTASGAICKHVCTWVRRFTKEDLTFYGLHFPKEPWQKLADICHFHPTKDFPSLDWFLPFCFGSSAPEGTMVQMCRDLNAETVNGLIKQFPIPYSHVKPYSSELTNESKAKVAADEKTLDTVLWWYEELCCREVDEVILKRLHSGESVNLPNGKLLERLLHLKLYRDGRAVLSRKNPQPSGDSQSIEKAPFYKDLIPIAQKRLDRISLSLESPIVVIGDASGSMEVAIRTSSIIAGLLTAITSAQLVFFNTDNIYPPYLPKNIEEVLQLAVDTHAGGGTAPAASLWPFYDKKEVVKTFIVVTDEEENVSYIDYMFHDLFKKYYEEVYPAKLVFVSFFAQQNSPGHMVPLLKNLGYKPSQFVFNSHQPDLTKLDKMFGLMASDASLFNDEIIEMEKIVKEDGLKKAFENMQLT